MRPWHVGMAAAGFLLAGGAAPLTAQGPPNAPVNLQADVTPESVFLTWEADNSGNRRTAVAFRIYRDDQRIGSSVVEEYFDFDVDEGKEYTYEVSGVDVLGREGNRSAPLTVVIPGGDPPDKPDDLVAVAVSASRIDLQWEAVGDDDDDAPTVVGYYIYRDGGSSPHDSTGATLYSDTGLAAFTVYTYRVSAVTAAGVEGDLSDPASVRTLDGSPPSAPNGVTAEATSAQSVELAWNAAQDPESGVSAYRVYRGGSLLGTSAGLGYVDLTVEPNTTYAYEVSAVNGVGLESARASAPPVTTPDPDDGPGDTAPDRPDNLVAEAVSASRIDLQWGAVGEDDDDDESAVVGYHIYRNGGNAPHASTGATQYSDTGLAAFTEYTYRVSAVTAGGVEGELSDPASARTLDGSPPSAPSNVSAEAPGARFVELTWNAAIDPESGISLYLVYRDGGAIPIDSTTATAYADGTVEPETSYAYRVAARNGVGLEGAKSAQVNVTTPAATDQSPPSVPGDFTAEAVSADRVELTWSAAEDPESGVSAYRVYRDDALLGTSPGVGYVDLTVEPNTTYEYGVSAVNGDGLEGARASAPPVTTPDAVEGPGDTVPPAPPTDLRVITG